MKKTIGIIFFFSFLFYLSAQKPSQELFDSVLAELKTEISDSTNLFEQKNAELKKNIIATIEKNHFDKEVLIGKDSIYIKSGMSKYYKKLFPELYFNPKIKKTNLPELYKKLEQTDIKLIANKNALKYINKKRKQWAYDTDILEEIFNDAYKINKDKEFLKFAVSATILSKMPHRKKVDLKWLNVKSKCRTDIRELENKDMELGVSLPFNGQFAYYPTFGTMNANQGFIYIKNHFSADFYEHFNNYKIKWTSPDGKFRLTDVLKSYNTGNTLNFYNPYYFLNPGRIYKMELVRFSPENRIQENLIDALKRPYLIFNVLQNQLYKKVNKLISKTYNPVYFRVSFFNSFFDKAISKEIQKIDDLDYYYITKESFSDFELNGDKCFDVPLDFVTTMLSNSADKAKNKLNKRIDYYLKVPDIEKTDLTNPNKNYIALSDNTLDEEAILFCNAGAANSYIDKSKYGEYHDIDVNQITVKLETATKKITKNDFDKNTYFDSKKGKIKVELAGIKNIQKKYKEVAALLRKRSKERADFYYKLHVIKSKREHVTVKNSKEFYLEREKEIIKNLLGENTDKNNLKPNKNALIYLVGKIPYTDFKVFYDAFSIK